MCKICVIILVLFKLWLNTDFITNIKSQNFSTLRHGGVHLQAQQQGL